jgi:hypothetical protein
MKERLSMKNTLALAAATLLASSVICVADSLAPLTSTTPAPAPSARPSSNSAGAKNMSADVNTRELPASVTAVKPLAPGEPSASGLANLSPAAQSQAGVGVQFHFGKGAKEKPSEDDADESNSD